MLVYDDRDDEEVENLHDYDYGYDYGLDEEDPEEENCEYQVADDYVIVTAIQSFLR